MNALPSHAPFLSPPPGRAAVSMEALAMCVRALDPGSRALLDLSLRRRLPFEAMAGVLHTDPFDLARRRARAVARIAAELDLEGAGVVATVKAALSRLPDDAWCVPDFEPVAPAEVQEAVQAESMAEAARALMEKLREHRERVREASIAAGMDITDQPTVEMEVVRLEGEVAEAGEWSATADPAQQDTVESQAIVLPPEPEPEPAAKAEPWEPMAATPMAAAFSHHPAFAVEVEHESAELPPLAIALAQAAASEREAAQAREAETPVEPEPPTPAAEQPTVETEAIRTPAPAADRPAQQLTVPHTVEREPRRRLARSGIVVGLLLALLRLLFGRR
jgi:hypothetical protein